MNSKNYRNLGAAFLCVGLVWAAGCARPQPALAPTKLTEVVVDTPIIQDVTEYEDFTGRTEGVLSIEIRARVSGYLQEYHFKDGTDVKKGDLLFSIDPVLYQAELDRAKAQLMLNQARTERLEKDFKRVSSLIGKGVSQAEADLITGDREEAKANVKVAEAAVRLAQQNLDWTKVTAPITGRISRRMIDPGNLVKADDTILTTLINLDQIYAYFDVDERTLLRLRRLVRDRKMYSTRERETHVKVGVADDDEFSLDGVINFVDNRVDASTGTLRLRALVENTTVNNVRLLSPGQFVRIRLPIGQPHPAILIPEEAIGTDQGQKYVYVLSDKDEVQYRSLRLGQQFDRYRAVDEGLSPGERVVVSGLQRIRPGVKVTPKMAAKQPAKPVEAPPADKAPTGETVKGSAPKPSTPARN